MSGRTKTRWMSDQAVPDGQIFIPASSTWVTGGTAAWTRNGSGDASLHFGNGQTGVMMISLDGVLARSGSQENLQEQFGAGAMAPFGAGNSAVGVPTTKSTASASASPGNVTISVVNGNGFAAGNIAVIDTGANLEYQRIISATATTIVVQRLTLSHTSPFTISQHGFYTPADVTGPPPFTGVTQLTPVTSARPKGVAFLAITPVYIIGAADATTLTIGLTQTAFSDNTAVSGGVTSILAVGANGLVKTQRANPYVTYIPTTVQTMRTTRNSQFTIEWNVTTPGGGTADIYGVFVDVAFNYQ